MAKEIIDLRKKLRSHKFEFDLLQKIPCSNNENKEYSQLLRESGSLPDGVFPYIYENSEISSTDFYTIYQTDLTESEINEYLTYKQLSLIRTIKNCVLFFTILTVIGMVAYLILLLNAF